MKNAVLALIAGVAGLMVYMALKGECRDGTIVTGEAQCRQSGAISEAACRTVMGNAAQLSSGGATVYRLFDQCAQHFEQCIRSKVADGFTPVPYGFCVATSGSTVMKQEPLYRRQNAGVNWNRG